MAHPILIADDESDMRMALTHALNRNGYSVEAASNGIEALEKFKRGKFSLVIADMKLPKMSGMEVLGEVKKISPQIPVIMITANGTIENAVEAMQEGASDYILKPFSAEVLESVVKKVGRNSNGQRKVKLETMDLSKGSRQTKVVTQDPRSLNILRLAKKIAPSRATVLIQGESGTGKEVFALFIHRHSGKAERPYVAINCASLPDGLAESELFGHEKGSFTGATNKKIGKFELANHGTKAEGLGSFMPDDYPVTLDFSEVPQYADAQVDIDNGVLICSTADEDGLYEMTRQLLWQGSLYIAI